MRLVSALLPKNPKKIFVRTMIENKDGIIVYVTLYDCCFFIWSITIEGSIYDDFSDLSLIVSMIFGCVWTSNFSSNSEYYISLQNVFHMWLHFALLGGYNLYCRVFGCLSSSRTAGVMDMHDPTRLNLYFVRFFCQYRRLIPTSIQKHLRESDSLVKIVIYLALHYLIFERISFRT